MREVVRGDKHNLRKSANRNAQISVIHSAHCTDLCFAICRFSQVVFVTSNLHGDLICYVHILFLPHLHVCWPFFATNGWPRVVSGLRRALYRVSSLAERGFVARVCFLGHRPNCVRTRSRDRNEPRGHVLSSRRQTFLRSMEELVTDLSLDLKKGLSVKLRNSNKTLASLTAGRVEKVCVDGVRDAMFGATFPAAAELPRC